MLLVGGAAAAVAWLAPPYSVRPGPPKKVSATFSEPQQLLVGLLLLSFESDGASYSPEAVEQTGA
jgi:hypothetical protein